jgi:arabinose-5-phosphate isomerase
VIVEMTQKRKGMTTVVDSEGRAPGVITDGDLRRLHLPGRLDRVTSQPAGGQPRAQGDPI